MKNDPFTKPQFKGWTKPGPRPAETREEPGEGETLDAISGFFRLFQLKKGHRFSTDDLLTAWYGTTWCPRAERVFDLGGGIGSVGMIAARRPPGVSFVTVEAQEESVRLARRSTVFKGIDARYEITLGDFRTPDILRKEESFDLILGSAPYFPSDTGVEGDHPQKIACRFELRGGIADYCRVAARHLAPGGWFACVFPTDQLDRVLAAAGTAGLANVRRRPIVLREGEPPLRNVFAMVREADLPEWFRPVTWVEPELLIRTREGGIHPEYSAVKLSIGFPP